MADGILGSRSDGSDADLIGSSYAAWDGSKFCREPETERAFPRIAENAYADLGEHILDESFSCVGAKAAMNGGLFRAGFYASLNTPATNATLACDLGIFAREQEASSTNYASFAAIFGGPAIRDEGEWESRLWTQLKDLHELDRRSFEWDPKVSSDPDNPAFSFSFAGTGFFVVGLNPVSSRLARRFSWAAMIFNPHAQFDRLRDINQYARLQSTIRAREIKLQGSLNPNLSEFGERSEARQYSGRAVEEKWKCPFSAFFRK